MSVYLVHSDTGLSTEVPDLRDVLDDFASRGWLPAKRPYAVPFVPSPDGVGSGKPLNPNDYDPDYTPVPESAKDSPSAKKVK